MTESPGMMLPSYDPIIVGGPPRGKVDRFFSRQILPRLGAHDMSSEYPPTIVPNESFSLKDFPIFCYASCITSNGQKGQTTYTLVHKYNPLRKVDVITAPKGAKSEGQLCVLDIVEHVVHKGHNGVIS